jgi:DHA1 family inner membrane transport protein
MYSYVAPLVTREADLGRSAIPWFLLAFGIGSVAGSWGAGRRPAGGGGRASVGGVQAGAAGRVRLRPLAGVPAALWVLVLLVGVLGSVLAINFQLRLMHVAGDAQMLGAALNHSALNIANGLGAWLGAVVIANGHGYRAPSLVGAVLAVAGLGVFLVALRTQRATAEPVPAAT